MTSHHSDLMQKRAEDEQEHDSDQSDEEISKPASRIPSITHRFRHDKSILALAVTSEAIYAGTQNGELLVYDLRTYERVRVIQAHCGSVLGFCLSKDEKLLFSSAGDRFVNVWDTTSLKHLASIYSAYDVGDVFCVSYSTRLETVYLGAQNTSIQWYNLKNYDSHPEPSPSSHPAFRQDKFFDSSGPGGLPTPRRHSQDQRTSLAKPGRNLEIEKDSLYQFAHFGYVYCMLLARGAACGVPTDEILISGGGDGVIKLWTLNEDGKGSISEIGQLDDGSDGGESVLTIEIDGTFLYSGRVDGEINVWDLETRQLLRTIKAYDQDVLTLAIGPGVLYSAFVDGTVMTFDQRHEPLGTWKAHGGRVLASGFTQSKGQSIYVTGGNDDTIAIWNVTACYGSQVGGSKTSEEEMLESLKLFVAYRSVSSNLKYEADCRRAASYIRSILKKFGALTEMLSNEHGRNPVVLGQFRGRNPSQENRTRILFYGHYDVISAENFRGKWNTEPFTLSGTDGYLYGRGVSDNKGPIIAAIYAVAELVMQQRLDYDVVFLIEGEEEQGSRGFKETVRNNKELIGPIDWILLANSYWLDDEVPCITYGLRGILRATVDIQSDEPDLHSGVDGSRLLDEPMKDLVMVLAGLTGPHGRVQIPGFYDSILPISEVEENMYGEIAELLLDRTPELGSREELIESLMGRWRDANLTIHRVRTSGPQNTTIIPSKASATLSMRLVPNQDLETIKSSFIRFLHQEFEKLESKNTLSISIDHEAEPWLGDYSNRIFQTLEKAVIEVWSEANPKRGDPLGLSPTSPPRAAAASPPNGWAIPNRRPSSNSSKPSATTSSKLVNTGNNPILSPIDTTQPWSAISTSPVERRAIRPRRPLYIREGGSIPAIRFLEKEFGAPAAHLPCGQASDNAHLDNERFRVLNLYNSKEIFKRVFEQLIPR